MGFAVALEASSSSPRSPPYQRTLEALNACMQREDEAEENATKSDVEMAANEAAKRDRAEKVLVFSAIGFKI